MGKVSVVPGDCLLDVSLLGCLLMFGISVRLNSYTGVFARVCGSKTVQCDMINLVVTHFVTVNTALY